MPGEFDGKHLKLWTPATYCIEVEGEVPESWSDRLGVMRITTRQRKDQTTVTTLIGRVRDQAELSGVLNTLYELHLPILSVENLERD
jgi:phage terminase small subunit